MRVNEAYGNVRTLLRCSSEAKAYSRGANSMINVVLSLKLHWAQILISRSSSRACLQRFWYICKTMWGTPTRFLL